MPEVIAEFSLPKSSKRYTLHVTDKDDLETVIKQFKLDLPANADLKTMKLKELNLIKPKSDPVIMANEFIDALVLLYQTQINYPDYGYFYMAKKQLTPIRIRHIFDNLDEVPAEVEIKPFWFYFVKQPLQVKHKDKPVAKKAAIKQQGPTLAELDANLTDSLNDVNEQIDKIKQDIANDYYSNSPQYEQKQQLVKQVKAAVNKYNSSVNILKAQVKQLDKDKQALMDGAKSYQAIMMHADETNTTLAKEVEQLVDADQQMLDSHEKQQEFLDSHFGKYLTNDTSKLQFLQSLLANINAPMVQQIIHGNPKALWHLVKAVCDYDKTT